MTDKPVHNSQTCQIQLLKEKVIHQKLIQVNKKKGEEEKIQSKFSSGVETSFKKILDKTYVRKLKWFNQIEGFDTMCKPKKNKIARDKGREKFSPSSL